MCALCRRGYRIASVLFLLLALPTQGAAAATIAVGVTSVADQIEIEASALLNADTETAWRVLTNYSRYVDFIPGLQECRVIARKGATVTVEQSGEVMLWLLHRQLDVTFEVTEVAPRRLDSRVVAGDLRAFSSRYVLTPAGGQVRLDYSGTLDSGLGAVWPHRAACGTAERHAPLPGPRRRDRAAARISAWQRRVRKLGPGLNRLERCNPRRG